MAILDSNKPVSFTQREIAVVIAQAVAKTGLPIPGGKFRNDVDHIQIDPIVIEARVTQPKQGVRLQFEVLGGFGISLNVKIQEFESDPAGYLKDLFGQLHPMMRNAQKLRDKKRIENQAMYDFLTKGVAANG
jgi:hypothetical protein